MKYNFVERIVSNTFFMLKAPFELRIIEIIIKNI